MVFICIPSHKIPNWDGINILFNIKLRWNILKFSRHCKLRSAIGNLILVIKTSFGALVHKLGWKLNTLMWVLATNLSDIVHFLIFFENNFQCESYQTRRVSSIIFPSIHQYFQTLPADFLPVWLHVCCILSVCLSAKPDSFHKIMIVLSLIPPLKRTIFVSIQAYTVVQSRLDFCSWRTHNFSQIWWTVSGH